MRLCAECKDVACVRDKGTTVGHHKQTWWLCPACTESALQEPEPTELDPEPVHWLKTISDAALKLRWGEGKNVTAEQLPLEDT
jgi:hypothetical protein